MAMVMRQAAILPLPTPGDGYQGLVREGAHQKQFEARCLSLPLPRDQEHTNRIRQLRAVGNTHRRL
jgi:hypothetical protein